MEASPYLPADLDSLTGVNISAEVCNNEFGDDVSFMMVGFLLLDYPKFWTLHGMAIYCPYFYEVPKIFL